MSEVISTLIGVDSKYSYPRAFKGSIVLGMWGSGFLLANWIYCFTDVGLRDLVRGSYLEDHWT